jgi:CheY-like chemotaxis protein
MPGGVLIVEDDDDMRESLQALLERKGFAVTSASNGLEALEQLRDGVRPGIILLDLMMPVMDGWELQRELAKDPALATIPVALLSGVAHLTNEAHTLGAVACFTKPVDLARLYALCREHCA